MLLDAKKHYDLMIEENNDSFHDSFEMKLYMSRWNQLLFDSVNFNTNIKVFLK